MDKLVFNICTKNHTILITIICNLSIYVLSETLHLTSCFSSWWQYIYTKKYHAHTWTLIKRNLKIWRSLTIQNSFFVQFHWKSSFSLILYWILFPECLIILNFCFKIRQHSTRTEVCITIFFSIANLISINYHIIFYKQHEQLFVHVCRHHEDKQNF